jgi:hypothetical protein
MGKYRSLGTLFNRVFRNDLNANFDDLDTDIKAVDGRVSNIVAQTGNSNTEIVDARLRKDGTSATTLGVHVRELETSLAQGKAMSTGWKCTGMLSNTILIDNITIDGGLSAT